jgi:glycerol-3-phosphate O-acyltransferase 3/4
VHLLTHKGLLQDTLLKPLKNIWFERFEAKDRGTVAERMKKHIMDKSNPPLMIFPEGVCVNNEYCVLFRKGGFELGAEICPIAIKYKYEVYVNH